MTARGSSDSPAPARATTVAVAVLLLVALLAYANSFQVPFLLDDENNILTNPSIRQWRTAFSPPSHAGVGDRPLLNATFALNYAFGGLHAPRYHAANLAIHFLGALALFGLVRRTLLADPLRVRCGTAAFPLALLVAVLWAAHPVQTNAVTYLSQRAESLMALFYLLTLYAFARGATCQVRGPQLAWYASAIASCLAGVFTKEIIATAPLAVLLYDRVFVAGSWREALRARWRWHGALALTWVPLALLLIQVGERSVGTAPGVTVGDYALTQCRALIGYVRVAFWPWPLNFYPEVDLVSSWREVAPHILALGLLAGALWFTWRRRPALAFTGLVFFLILAPTSSFIPIRFMPVAESRVYLPSAAALAAAVVVLYALLGRRTFVVGAVIAALLTSLAVLRNRTYQSPLALWTQTAALSPNNPNVHSHLAHTCWVEGRLDEAIRHWTHALELGPNFPQASFNLAVALVQAGRWREAVPRYLAAIRLRPDFAKAHTSLGNLLLQQGQLAPALGHLRIAARLNSKSPDAHLDLGVALTRAGQPLEAVRSYERALAIDPRHAPTHNNLANQLAETGRLPDALSHYEAALRLQPDYFEALCNYGNRLGEAGRGHEGLAHLERAVQLRPTHAGARFLLGQALERVGRRTEAALAMEHALRLDPAIPLARDALARLRAAPPE